MGRSAAGVKGIELREGAAVVGIMRVPMVQDPDDRQKSPMTTKDMLDRNLCLLTITDNGYGKRTPVDEYRVNPEDGSHAQPVPRRQGPHRHQDLTERNGTSPWPPSAVYDDRDVVVISRGWAARPHGRRTRSASYGRGTQGVRVVSLNDGG